LLAALKRFLRKALDPDFVPGARTDRVIRRLRAQGVRIGEGCRIYSSDFSLEPYLVTLGDGVGIAGGVKIITHNGAARILRHARPGVQSFGRVTIGDDTFIGENAIILPGTSIGRMCIVAAGSVVRGRIPDNSMVVGNPARVVGRTSLYLRHLDRNPLTMDTFHLSPEAKRRAILDRLGREN